MATTLMALIGCGGAPLSLIQLRDRAGAICHAADRRLTAIPPPATPAGTRRFLSAGLAAMTPEVQHLRRLSASKDASDVYRDAVQATSAELADVRRAVAALRAGAGPVSTLRGLQAQLAPLENQADGAWQALEVPAWLSR